MKITIVSEWIGNGGNGAMDNFVESVNTLLAIGWKLHGAPLVMNHDRNTLVQFLIME